MKSVYYHGTSADNLPYILNEGIKCSHGGEVVWNCSGESIYLWGCNELIEAGECDEDEAEERAFQMAFESGQIACAVAKDCRVVVFRIELESEEVEADTSCENMEGSGAVCISRDILIEEITEIKISNDYSLLRGYFISMIIDRDYNNLSFTAIERQIAAVFQKSDLFLFDTIYDLQEWEIVHLPVITYQGSLKRNSGHNLKKH